MLGRAPLRSLPSGCSVISRVSAIIAILGQMKAVGIGGGIVGVTSAYYLAKDGHEVTLIEREPALATLASAGNAGLIAPGHSFAWASPSAPKELWRSLTVEDTARRVNPIKAPGMFFWGLSFLRECNADRATRNTLVKLRLARYSQGQLDALTSAENIDYHDAHQGCLYVYRDRAKFEAGVKKMKPTTDQGLQQQVLDPDSVIDPNPGLRPLKDKIVGRIYAVTHASRHRVKLPYAMAV